MNMQEAHDYHKSKLGNRWTYEVRDGWQNADEVQITLTQMDERGNSPVQNVGDRGYRPAGEMWSELVDKAVALKEGE
tara:strand:- start:1355 stop:1585 length:231 start_codon:yes stop_codon:yes gene_type:complete